MFKRMKLGTKIGVGFGLLILITVALGGLAAWNMQSAGEQSTVLANQFMPEVQVATSLQNAAQEAMYNIRGYVYSDDETFLTEGRKCLGEAKKSVADAGQLATRSSQLASLRSAAEAAEGKLTEYERLLGQTVEKAQEILKLRATQIAIAERYVKVIAAFLEQQDRDFKNDVANGAERAKLEERLQGMALANEVVGLVNAARVAFWKGQCLRQPKLLEDATACFDKIGKKLDELKTLTRDTDQATQLDELRAAGEEYRSNLMLLVNAWNRREAVGKERAAAATGVLTQASNIAEKGVADTMSTARAAASNLGFAGRVTLGGLGVAVVLGVVLATLIARSITKPIQRIIAGLTEGAAQVNDAAGQVSSASQQLAEGASEQASSLEETSSALEQMAAMTRANAANAKEANDLADQTRTAAHQGDQTMAQLNSAMTGINESSEKISKIIKVIEEIAFQTNLLALNAAVEAARAGEHGKGFAVVAEEVRNLAQRAAGAARETTELIENSVVKTREGAQVAGDVGQALTAIVGHVGKVTELINGIAKASEEQAQGVDQVNTAVSQMDKVTQQNAAGAEESASAAEQLAAQAQTVHSVVDELVMLVDGRRRKNAAADSHAAGKKAAPRQHAAAASHPAPARPPAVERPVPNRTPGMAEPSHAGPPANLTDF